MLWVLNPRPRWWESARVICFAGLALTVIAAELLRYRSIADGIAGAAFDVLCIVGMTVFLGSFVIWYLRAVQHVWYREQIRRARTDVCPQCGYDLRGLFESRCPECGTNTYAAAREARENLSRSDLV
jgi:uncharacterized paraquat-inducible protein A